MKKGIKFLVGIGVISSLFGGISNLAFADYQESGLGLERARDIRSYSVSVPRVNGSGYTEGSENATKKVSSQSGATNLKSSGGKKLDIRMQHSDGTNSGSYARSVSPGERRILPNSILKGKTVRLHLSNDLTTTVRVTAVGDWSPEDK